MQDLFLPNNLELEKDGSVYPKDFMKDIQPLPNEEFDQYYKRYWQIASKLKDYEVGGYIPIFQQKTLYKVEISRIPTKLTWAEEDSCLEPKLVIVKWFLNLESAKKWATNKIKQQSVGFYYSKDNPHSRQYKFTYSIIHNGDDVIEESAINGKFI